MLSTCLLGVAGMTHPNPIRDRWIASFALGGSLAEIAARVRSNKVAAHKAMKRYGITHTPKRDTRRKVQAVVPEPVTAAANDRTVHVVRGQGAASTIVHEMPVTLPRAPWAENAAW